MPGPWWGLVVATAGAVLRFGWWGLALVAVVVVPVGCAQQFIRRSPRRLARRSGPEVLGFWVGRIPGPAAESLWGARLPRGLDWVLYVGTGWPVTLRADPAGITVVPRGPVLTRMRRFAAALIPWSDLVGARERDLGFTDGDMAASLLRMTRVTLGLVGPSAEGRLPPPTDEQIARMLRAAGIDPEPLPAGNGAGEDPDDAEDADDGGAFFLEIYGADWTPGTWPLPLTTLNPRGLVEVVTQRATGKPEPDLW